MTVDIIKDMSQPKSNIFIPRPDVSPSATSVIIPMSSGFYRLDCYVRYFEFDEFGVWYVKSTEPLGKKDNVRQPTENSFPIS
jgi:hypothetical protein